MPCPPRPARSKRGCGTPPSRVVVYVLLTAGLFAELGYGQMWAKMIAGLDVLTVDTSRLSAVPKPGAGSASCRCACCSTAAGPCHQGRDSPRLLVTAIYGTTLTARPQHQSAWPWL